MTQTVNVRWHRLKHGQIWARQKASEERMWREIEHAHREREMDSRNGVSTARKTGSDEKPESFHQTWGDVFGDLSKVFDNKVDPAKIEELRTAIVRVGQLIQENGSQHKNWKGICWVRDIEDQLQTDVEKRLVERMKRRDDLTGDFWIWPESFTVVSGWEFTDLFAPPVPVKVQTPRYPRSRVPSDAPKKDTNWRLFFACKE